MMLIIKYNYFMRQRFKICDTELKKIKEPPKNIEEDDENIYYSLKKWK